MPQPPLPPILELLRFALATEEHHGPWPKRLAQLSPRDWRKVVEQAREHRIGTFILEQLERRDLADRLPPPWRADLSQERDQARSSFHILDLSFHSLASELTRLGILAVACKGIVLARNYYPSPGSRPMSDIDLWINSADRAAMVNLLKEHGFHLRPDTDGADGGCFENALGVQFDVHHRMRLAEQVGLTLEQASLPILQGTVRVFEPHFFLCHLTVHFASHAQQTGPLLAWLVDIALVLRKHGKDLSLPRLRQAFPDEPSWTCFARVLAFLDSVLGETLPETLAPLARHAIPFDAAQLLRERRRGAWRLSEVRGWARLARALLRQEVQLHRAYPKLFDLASTTTDCVTSTIANRRSAQRLRDGGVGHRSPVT